MKDQRENYPQENHRNTARDSSQSKPSRKVVYTIIEREGQEKNFWLRVGTAFTNRDDSLTVYLNALPTNNRLHIRDAPDSVQN